MSTERIKIKVEDIRIGDVTDTGRTVTKVTRRKAGRRHDRPVRAANAGRIRARVTIDFDNGMRMIRDPNEITFVTRRV